MKTISSCNYLPFPTLPSFLKPSRLYSKFLPFQVTATERENRQQSELIAALRMDKEGLEGSLYETQSALGQLEVRKQQLEVENQDLLVRKENLQGA